jgi:hypothetical protein
MIDVWTPIEKVHPRARATLAIVGGWLAFWAPLIVSSGVPYERDILMTTLPWRQYFHDRLLSGHWAQWYPYELMGVPYSGSIIASPFHPQTLLYLLFSPSVATKWCLLLGSLIGLTGAYRFSRALGGSRLGAVTAAYVFALGGYAVSLTSNPTYQIPLMTAPWFLRAAHRVATRGRRPDIVAMAVWWALIFTGGDVQLCIECGMIAAAIVLIGAPNATGLTRYGVAALLTGCLAAAELIPAYMIEDESVRAIWEGNPILSRAWAFSPLRFFDFLLPHFIPLRWRLDAGAAFEGQPDLFASTVFIGGTALLFLGLGIFRGKRRAILWGVLIVLGCWLSLGRTGSLLGVWWKLVPLFDRFRFPEKYIALVALALIPLVAWGADEALQAPSRVVRIALIVGTVLLFAAAVARTETLLSWGTRIAGLQRPLGKELARVLGEAWSGGLMRTGAELLALGAAFLLIQNDARLSGVVPGIVFVTLFLGNTGRIPLASPGVVDNPGVFARELQKRQVPAEPPPRVVAAAGGTTARDLPDDELVRQIHLWLLADDAGRGGVTAWGENSSAERDRVIRLLGVKDAKRWWPRLGVCYRVANDKDPHRMEETIVSELSNPYLALVQTDCQPRAFLASATRSVRNEDAAIQAMREGLPLDAIVWEGGPNFSEGGGTVRWLEAQPEHLKLEVSTVVQSALVVGDAYALGWAATMDGKPAAIHPTDGASRGVVVPAGHHVVEMTYSAPGLLEGVLLSLVGILGCILLVSRYGRLIPYL